MKTIRDQFETHDLDPEACQHGMLKCYNIHCIVAIFPSTEMAQKIKNACVCAMEPALLPLLPFHNSSQ